jgi:putative tricarboxylic transport membrane protein
MGAGNRRSSLRMADRVIFVCILVLAGVYFYATEQLPTLEIGDPLGPKAFPRLLGIALVITAGILLLEIMRRRRRPEVRPADEPDTRMRGAYVVVGAVVVWTFLYIFAFETLGYVIATAIYLFVMTSYFNTGKWVANALTSVLFCLGSYWMFKILGVSLAQGLLPF